MLRAWWHAWFGCPEKHGRVKSPSMGVVLLRCRYCGHEWGKGKR